MFFSVSFPPQIFPYLLKKYLYGHVKIVYALTRFLGSKITRVEDQVCIVFELQMVGVFKTFLWPRFLTSLLCFAVTSRA